MINITIITDFDRTLLITVGQVADLHLVNDCIRSKLFQRCIGRQLQGNELTYWCAAVSYTHLTLPTNREV